VNYEYPPLLPSTDALHQITSVRERTRRIPARAPMKRRRLLAALAGGAGALAGCVTDPGSRATRTPTPEPTPPPSVTTVTERKPLPTPTPDDASNPAAAQSFVATHERRLVHNDLVDGFASSPAIEVSVERPTVGVVDRTDRGYYLLSTCRGSARYWDPDGSPSGASRNAAGVAHFVGPDRHRRIPFNAYRCLEPVVASSDGDGERDGSEPPAARFQLYDFHTPPDYDHPERGGRAVDVTVTDANGATVLDETYRTSLPLTIQPRVTETPGRYALTASLADGARVEHAWSPSGPADPSWWALAVVVTAGGDLRTGVWYPNETVGLPDGTLCRRLDE